MNKLVVFFVFTFTSMSILSAVVERGHGLVATQTTAAMAVDDTILFVTSTAGFLGSASTGDKVYVNSEIICYGSLTATSFTSLTRGCDGSEAQAHLSGTRAYNETTSIVNQMAGFNVTQTLTTAGSWKAPVMVPYGLLRAFAKIVLWDFSYLEGDMVYFKYIMLYPLSVGFVYSLVSITATGFGQVFRR